MVSYYNSLSYSQKHSAANLPYPAGQPWAWQANYHPPPNHQFLGDVDSPHAVPHHTMQYYNHMFGNHPPADWHSTENFQNATQSHLLQQQHHQQQQQHHQQQQHQHQTGATQLNDSASSAGEPQTVDGLPSPPITVSCGSEISSPGAPASSSSPHPNLSTSSNNNNSTTTNNTTSSNNTTVNNNTNRSSPIKSPYYDWMKKQTYSAQPTPGKTRTKDKYRVVYTDYQRLELEKEYCTSRYITIRRKTELAQSLQLSERQVKIWFQNRRAKERKQNKKRDDPMSAVAHSDLSSYMDTKPKIEPSLHHLQHTLHHPMSSMAMNMPMSLHHHHPVLHHGHHLPPPQHLQSQMSAAAAAALPM